MLILLSSTLPTEAPPEWTAFGLLVMVLGAIGVFLNWYLPYREQLVEERLKESHQAFEDLLTRTNQRFAESLQAAQRSYNEQLERERTLFTEILQRERAYQSELFDRICTEFDHFNQANTQALTKIGTLIEKLSQEIQLVLQEVESTE